MTLSETAWGAHESHGDTLGPCDGYGGEEKQAKQAGKKKGRKRDRAGSNGDYAEVGIDEFDRAGEDEDRGSGEDFGERDSRGERDEIEDADRRSGRRTERRQRPARHRERRSRAGSEARSPAADESDITDRAVPGNEVDDGDSSAAASAIEAASQPITRDSGDVESAIEAASQPITRDSGDVGSAIEAASQPITSDLDPAERRERNRTSDAQPDDTALP
jgi:hypothetical protein